jgi:hypothetical protein
MARPAPPPEDAPDLPAGAFSAWLERTLAALASGGGTDVACGECTACCTSSYFIHVEPDETGTIASVDRRLLVPAPGLPANHLLLGYDAQGRCPALGTAGCSIYGQRPRTCRAYDCRVFAAAGIPAGGADKARITRQSRRWRFAYPLKRDREEHAAVQAAARFLQEHPEAFPGGRTPEHPSQVAVLALKACRVFLGADRAATAGGRPRTNAALARAFVRACRTFDERRDREAARRTRP